MNAVTLLSDTPEELMRPTAREKLECMILESFPQVKPLEASDYRRINRYKNGAFGRSLLSFMLYANGHNTRGYSLLHPGGLLYDDGKVLFSIGIFRRRRFEDVLHPMINAPYGEDVLPAIDRFIKRLRALPFQGQGAIYVRHLDPITCRCFLRAGFRNIRDRPWISEAPSEDETYNHKLIELDSIIALDPNKGLQIKTLELEGSRGFRKKARLSYNRFANFLERNGMQLEMEDYRPGHRDMARQLVVNHFGSLRNPIGSSPQDYFCLVDYQPEPGHVDYYGKIGFLLKDDLKIPIMLFIGEAVGYQTVALYATFALREPEFLPEGADTKGFTAISQYCYLRIFEDLLGHGIHRVNVGGSETHDLNTFKRQLGAEFQETCWVLI